jgi:hypothetical protein
MTCVFARAGAWLLALVAVAGCGDRRLDLALALASDSCTSTVPAGGSLMYQVSQDGSDGGNRAFCGACLAVDSDLVGANAILAFLRSHAPSCPGLTPGGAIRVALTASAQAGCTDGSSRIFCSTSADVPLPDGRTDAVLSVVLTCDVGCAGVCRPTTCQALNKDCGTISDGCSSTLNCGGCIPPQQCGGHAGSGIPNVCSK